MKGKIVFMVENDVDQVIVETLVKRLVPSLSGRFRTVPMGTLAGFSVAYIGVIELLRKYPNYRFLVLFDTNTTDVYEIESLQNLFADPMKRYGLFEYVTFCPIIPNLNSWLLGKYQLPVKQFGQKFDFHTIKQVAGRIDLTVLKQENANFRRFAEALQSYIQQQDLHLKKAA